MNLDGTNGDEEAAGDLLVGETVCRELDHAPLSRRQLVRPLFASAASDAHQLGTRLLRPAQGTQLVEPGRGLLERAACRAPLLHPALSPSESEAGARGVEAKPQRAVPVGGIGEIRRRLVEAGGRKPDESAAALRTRQTPWMFLLFREPAQALCHPSRLLELAQLYERLDQIGCNREGAGLVHSLALHVLPDGREALGCARRFGREQRSDPSR